MAKQQLDTVYKIVDVVGVSEKSWEDAGRNAVETAAESPRVSDENGYEGRKREGHGISHAGVALLQVRILMAIQGVDSVPTVGA